MEADKKKRWKRKNWREKRREEERGRSGQRERERAREREGEVVSKRTTFCAAVGTVGKEQRRESHPMLSILCRLTTALLDDDTLQ